MLYYDNRKSGERIKELRKAKKVTQEVAAYDIGISTDGYRNIEQGKNGASIITLMEMAQYFNTTIDYIVTGRKCVVVEDEENED
ncbi:helix-turn-helix transcriptional regulator [uncultured Eubacterium sp.]|uniref:helix-turn-helix domain-containing protein n=1 Tax=uncultured Eubacterium sp. TaxID=165185 RepID=UPI00262E1875|nr:helix-turn-helix transcriptional regulator [uncultured Eubacterium sp.]